MPLSVKVILKLFKVRVLSSGYILWLKVIASFQRLVIDINFNAIL